MTLLYQDVTEQIIGAAFEVSVRKRCHSEKKVSQ